MAMYLRPRRGKKATAIAQNIILKRGEVFFESPTTGVGTGIGKIKIGDGFTAYDKLPYFLEQSVTNVAVEAVTFTENSSTDNTTLLGTIKSGATTATLFGAIKKLLSNFNSSIGTLNSNFQNFQSGVNTIVGAVNTRTGRSESAGNLLKATDAPSTIADAIVNIPKGKDTVAQIAQQSNAELYKSIELNDYYKKLNVYAVYTHGHAQGVKDADARADANTANYQAGHTAGRNSIINGSLTNSGQLKDTSGNVVRTFSNSYDAGKRDGKTEAINNNRTITISADSGTCHISKAVIDKYPYCTSCQLSSNGHSYDRTGSINQYIQSGFNSDYRMDSGSGNPYEGASEYNVLSLDGNTLSIGFGHATDGGWSRANSNINNNGYSLTFASLAQSTDSVHQGTNGVWTQ